MADDGIGMPRRELLAGIAAMGTVGAFGGADTGSLLSDHESLVGNLLAAGELDLELCWETHDSEGNHCEPSSQPASLSLGTLPCDASETASIRYRVRENPGWLWFRTGCPVDACGLEKDVKLSIWYDDGCDGDRDTDDVETPERYLETNDGTPIEEMRLCDALSALHDGVLVDGDPASDDPSPLPAGTDRCLGVEWTVDGCICEPDELEIPFEFYTEQARHVEEPSNPWPDETGCGVDCDDTDDCQPCPDYQGISFVAFCTDDPDGIDDGDVTFVPYFDVEGEAYRVDWSSDVQLNYVVLKYATTFENFAVPDGTSSGTATVGEGSSDLPGQSSPSPCPDGSTYGVKYEFDEDRWEATKEGGA